MPIRPRIFIRKKLSRVETLFHRISTSSLPISSPPTTHDMCIHSTTGMPVATTTNAVLPDLLPPDLMILLATHLVETQSMGTLASLQSTSKTNYDLLSSYLHQKRTLNTGNLTLSTALSSNDKEDLALLEQKAKRGGWLYGSKGNTLRARIHMQYTRSLIVDSLTLPPDRSPSSRVSSSSYPPNPLPNVDTVVIHPPVLETLAQYFCVEIVETFLRPLSQICTPSNLILHLADDVGLGSLKHLLNVLDELRWPQLRTLTVHNVNAQAIPSRPGLQVFVHFAANIPVKWNSSPLPIQRQIPRYEKSRLTQMVMAIARSVRTREGARGLGSLSWRFIGAGGFFEKYAKASGENLEKAVREWAAREYMAAGWSEVDVSELLCRISFEY